MKLSGIGLEDKADGAVLSKVPLVKTILIPKAPNSVAFHLAVVAGNEGLREGAANAKGLP